MLLLYVNLIDRQAPWYTDCCTSINILWERITLLSLIYAYRHIRSSVTVDWHCHQWQSHNANTAKYRCVVLVTYAIQVLFSQPWGPLYWEKVTENIEVLNLLIIYNLTIKSVSWIDGIIGWTLREKKCVTFKAAFNPNITYPLYSIFTFVLSAFIQLLFHVK